MPAPAALSARRSRLTARLEERDDFGLVLLLILATIMTVSLGAGAVGQFIGVCLSGFTLLFVLHTSDARRRTFRAALAIVVIAVGGTAVSLISGAEGASTAAGLIGLLLAFAAPVIILRRILSSPTITVRLVLGALAIYLLVGLTYAYLYPVVAEVTNEPFFVQTSTPEAVDYVYFSYVTMTTVGYGDFTASTSVGRMIAVSEALTGQLYLVSAVALLVGNIGRTIVRGARRADIEIAAGDDGDDQA
jgi:Ion channel